MSWMIDSGAVSRIATPTLVIDAETVRNNVRRLADYAARFRLNVRPHADQSESRLLRRGRTR